MVAIREASENALAFVRATLDTERSADARLEEVESITANGEGAWLITLRRWADWLQRRMFLDR